MNKEQQNLTWACLPKEERHKIISVYACKNDSNTPYNEGYRDALRQLYGHHNLVSDTEPPERLMVERSKVIRKYKFANICDKNHPEKKYWEGARITLKTLFGDKCLPDDGIATAASIIKPETKDNKESKKLNLCELLKGCEGRRFWSDTYGYVILFHVDGDFLIFLTKIESLSLLVEPDGTSAHTGKIVVFPSRSKRNWDEYGVSEFSRKES